MKRLFFGLLVASVALGGSAFTNAKSDVKFVGEIYVNANNSGDYLVLGSTYNPNNCQELNEFVCAYIRTNFQPTVILPTEFTDDEAQDFVTAGWLAQHSETTGVYQQ